VSLYFAVIFILRQRVRLQLKAFEQNFEQNYEEKCKETTCFWLISDPWIVEVAL